METRSYASTLSASAALAGARLEGAKSRLDRLDWYPRPVRVERVRVIVVPALFRLPWFRRFAGYAGWDLILLRRPRGGGRRPAALQTAGSPSCRAIKHSEHKVLKPLNGGGG